MKFILTFVLTINLSLLNVFGQITEGPNSPTSANADNGLGSVGWVFTSDAISSDDMYAYVLAASVGDISGYLVVSDFNFSIPASSTITGITVEVEKYATGVLQNVTDNIVSLMKGGATIGDNNASATPWPGSDANTYSSYGGSSNLWGTTWTPSEINASGFGLAISVDLSGSVALPVANIDHIRITIHYSTPLPVELLEFYALKNSNDIVTLSWVTASEINNDRFELFRSIDGITFDLIAKISGNGSTTEINRYEYMDSPPNVPTGLVFYQLRQVDYDGIFEDFKVISLVINDIEANTITVYPNPVVDDFLYINGISLIRSVLIIDNSGKTLIELSGPLDYQNRININSLPVGTYQLLIDYGSGLKVCKVIIPK